MSVPAVQTGWIGTPFAAFGPTHAFIAVMALGVCLACGVLARRESERGRRAFADGFAGVVLGWNLLANLWWVLPTNWEIGSSLPLHVCDLANLIIPFAIWTRSRTLLTVAIFWGLGLSTQAFVTPTVNEAPDDLRYWLFWGGHLWIAAGCCVIAGGTGYRPRWRDYWVATGVSLVTLLGLMGLNGWLGTNYGYVGDEKPSTKTLIDFLGPWPLRVVWLFLIASVAHALVLLLYPVLPRVLGVRSGGPDRR